MTSRYLFNGIFRTAMLLLAVLLLGGCISHEVGFQDVSYAVAPSTGAKDPDTALTIVIDPQTRTQTVTIHSFMTGIGNDWNTDPGQMLVDVATIEFPQIFGQTKLVEAYEEPATGTHRAILKLTIPSYKFADFHASITVHAAVYAPGTMLLWEKDYSAEGATQGTKMFFGGAFAMKSAIRQSSLDAYKQIFAQLRPELEKIVQTPPATGLTRPPRPVTMPTPAYPLDLKKRGIEGVVVVEFIVGTDGMAHEVKIISAPDPLLGAAVLDASKDWRFDPGVREGKAVAVKLSEPITFAIKSE